MKWQIIFLYNLNEIKVYKSKKNIKIKSKNKEYILNEIIEQEKLYEIYNILNNKTEKYKIIKNIYGEIISNIGNKKYVLMENNNLCEIKSQEIVLDSIKYQNSLINRSNWKELWSKKNDFYDNHKQTLKKNFPILYEYTDYFLGLAENALLYIIYNNIKVNKLTICCTDFTDENNPIKIILDTKEREIAEKLKYKFFRENMSSKKIIEKINQYKFDINLFYARMLYPTYYFNLYDLIVTNKIPEEKIKDIVKKEQEYEKILKYIQKKTTNLYKIDWL